MINGENVREPLPENHWEPVRTLLPVICKFFTVIVSGSQWFSVVLSGFWEAISIKVCDRNNATAGESMHTDLCTAVYRQWSQLSY